MDLEKYYQETKKRLLAECTKCGNCIKNCRIIDHADIKGNPREIQEDILKYLNGEGELSAEAQKKVEACMRCFGCLDVKCPIDVTSTMINEFVDRETEERKETPWDMVLYPSHDKLARKGTTEEEYERITAEIKNSHADILFFPGCNVYKQPDKLLNALTILDEIAVPYSFAPGMKYCCGWSARGCAGDATWLQTAAQELMEFAESLKIKKMVFWCPTCMCVLNDRIHKFYKPPFECITFGQYVLENIEKLSFPSAKPQRITYHEPCKTAYMGIDAAQANSVRNILKQIPGTELIEMEHRGENTLCCGCDAIDKAFEVGDKMTVARLREAKQTGADTMIDVCHNCHWIFKPAQHSHVDEGFDFSIKNYSTYITDAMGKSRKDTLDD